MKIDTATANVINPDDWVYRYLGLLKNYAFVRVSDDFVVEDLVQETFLAALKAKDNFKGKAKESTWLISILRHKIVDHYRRANTYNGKMRRNSFSADELFEKYNIEIRQDDADENAITQRIFENELESIIEDGFTSLTLRESKAMRLKMDDNSTETICKELGVSRQNFWVITSRARQKLRNHLDVTWFETL